MSPHSARMGGQSEGANPRLEILGLASMVIGNFQLPASLGRRDAETKGRTLHLGKSLGKMLDRMFGIWALTGTAVGSVGF